MDCWKWDGSIFSTTDLGLQFFPIRPMAPLEPPTKNFGFHATIQQYGLQKKLKAQRGRGEN
jgi:hypothetical protein